MSNDNKIAGTYEVSMLVSVTVTPAMRAELYRRMVQRGVRVDTLVYQRAAPLVSCQPNGEARESAGAVTSARPSSRE